GISQLALGDETRARAAFERARRQAPRDGAALFYLAWIEERGGRLAQARQLVDEALRLDGGLVDARALLGKVLLGQDAPIDAARHLDKAAAAKPEDASIRYLLAQAYQRAGRTEAAARQFEEARRLKAREVARERARKR
ncbi:MAG: tetratricopeptide repeat protein, partial [Vicinamibacteraceae bacterium]